MAGMAVGVSTNSEHALTVFLYLSGIADPNALRDVGLQWRLRF
jgi:hypothetical protein